jgi:phosphoserine phosphatase RsbX
VSPNVAHLSQPKTGEKVNGDAVLVRRDGDALMLAVVDGLGHGPIAAEAAQAAIASFEAQAFETSVLSMMQSAHDALRGTRGVAATLCVIRNRTVEACAVGNVQLSCSNADIPLVLSAGILGQRVQKYRVCQGQLQRSARIAVFTDGLSTRVSLLEVKGFAPDAACRALFDRHRRTEDDATILIADLAD